MTSVSVVWSTPNPDNLIAYMARVSNPSASLDDPNEKLIAYLIRKKHWSPFDMANLTVEVRTTRDIARQIMRHWSLKFHELNVQEFSQRYADVQVLGDPVIRKARLQDTKNRQSSIMTDNKDLQDWWEDVQRTCWQDNIGIYAFALEKGIAKEQARAVLPEGITPTKFMLNGTARQWVHYLDLRTDPGTQLEHREVATALNSLFVSWAPATAAAAERLRQQRLIARDSVTALIEAIETGKPTSNEIILNLLKNIKDVVA